MNELELALFLTKLDLETEKLDHVLDNLTDDEVDMLFDDLYINILPVSPLTQEILSKSPKVEVLTKGTNWQTARIDAETYERLDHCNQFPYFGFGETINNFR